MKPDHYGRYYWCVKTDLSDSGEIYLHADQAEISPNGELTLCVPKGDGSHVNMAFAVGHWKAVHAASVFDGAPVAVQHWSGEVVNG